MMTWRGEVEDGTGWGGLVASKSEQRAEARQSALEKDAQRYRKLRNASMDERNRWEHYAGPARARDVAQGKAMDAERQLGGRVKAIIGRLRAKHIKFRVGRMTFWLYPFWWGAYQNTVGSGWLCLSWVRRPANVPLTGGQPPKGGSPC